MADTITNMLDVIDSRDILERIEDLQEMKQAFEDGEGDALDDEEETELTDLINVQKQAEGYGDWEYGETLIRGSHFQDYAQDLAEDTGDIDFSKLAWPLTCIDWEQAARELKMDYTSIDFAGVEYLMRS